MPKESPFTIINDERLRGVVAPTKVISKELLEDMIDLVELSSRAMIQETNRRVMEADRHKSWIPLARIKSEIQ